MSLLLLAKIAYIGSGVICYGICGWVIYDNFKQARQWRFNQAMLAEWHRFRKYELKGWIFSDGVGNG